MNSQNPTQTNTPMNVKTPAGSRSRFKFGWDIVDMIIRGQSTIDYNRCFHIKTMEDAHSFIRSYGYDMANPIERAEVQGIFQESVNFIRKLFLQPDNPDGLKLEIPRKILELREIAELFLMASLHLPGQSNDVQGQYLRSWACSVLKVMHTVAHVDKDLRSPYFLDIQMQILDRFYKVIHRDADGKLYLGDKDVGMRVNLVTFETKPKKARDSILLKLLHKPENVAEDIFDRVGIRFVTETPLGALQVIKYLNDQLIVMAPNMKPSRARNTLIDHEDFQRKLNELLSQAGQGTLNEVEFYRQLEDAAHPPKIASENPHSSKYYRSIQLTCRQLIKLKNPLYDEIKELKQMTRHRPEYLEIYKNLERFDLTHVQKEIRFFYPYEIQVFDRISAEENERGRAAHSEYKRGQIQAALKRVMGPLAQGGGGSADAPRL